MTPKEKHAQQTKAWFAAHPHYARDRYRSNPELYAARMAEWRKKQKRLGRPICAERTEYQRRWREANRARLRKYFADYRNKKRTEVGANSRNYKARKKGAQGKHARADIEIKLIEQSGCCFWCASPMRDYHVDHVVPLVKGGSNGPDNLVLACATCNISKGDRLPEEWPQRPSV